MIEVSVFYPNDGTTRFDSDYYCNRHIPMVRELLGAALLGTRVQKGALSLTPGERAPFHLTAQLSFESVEAFQQAFAPHSERILADIPNYTDVEPILQISEILLPKEA